MKGKIVVYVSSAVLGIVCAVVLSGYFMVVSVCGNGMEPALSSGDRVVVAKNAYHDRAPKVGELVAVVCDVYGENGEGNLLIRRVVGEPGDLVEIRQGVFYRNGEPYENNMWEAVNMEDMEKVQLRKDQFFVLCDNRKSVMDSRNEALGILQPDDCRGKVCLGQRRIGKDLIHETRSQQQKSTT